MTLSPETEEWYEANERVMEYGAEFWKAEKARWAAVKRRLRITTFEKVSQMQIATAWADLGFPLKPWMKDIL